MIKPAELTVEDFFDHSRDHDWLTFLRCAYVALAITFIIYIIV